MKRELVIVLDFGGQYNQLVARRVRECNVYCEIYSYKVDIEKIKEMNPKGIILTGGPNSCYEENSPTYSKELFELGIPVLGSGYLFETTFQREATSDLTGERGSLMGAIQGLLLAQYEVLRENGHTPSEAFNETVEELTQSLMPLFAKNGMDWMYANCSTTAQRGALDWMTPFHDAIKPVVQKLYASVKSGNEAQISIDSNSQPDYREKLNEELRQLRESEMWQTAVTGRQLRPENN